MTFHNLIIEELGELKRETPTEFTFKKVSNEKYVGKFSIGKSGYSVEMIKMDEWDINETKFDEWDINFYQTQDKEGKKIKNKEKGQLITGGGNVKKVIRTVLEIAKKFINKEKPGMISFATSDDSRGRKALYNRIVNNVKDHTSYERFRFSSENNVSGTGIFTLIRKDLKDKI